jgi:2-phospho-L-lactate guanylyltransferase (CobY/MobA/RfbA family)
MIQRFYDKTFTNKRLVWYEETSELQDYSSFKGHLQQLGAEDAESLGMAWTKSFKIWCDIDTDIEVGDEIAEGSKSYTIKAIKILDMGGNKHKELYVEL